MASLQIRDIDDRLYQTLKANARKKHRSIKREVIMMLESYLGNPGITAAEATKEFLTLTWYGTESAEEIINGIHKQRLNSERFKDQNDLFD